MASPWITGPVSHIFNLSYRTSVVPVQWMRSCITPVPKIAHPVECKDFRPILVTPVLSRVMERFIVRSDLYPVLVHPDFSHLFSDQFAFRPSGFTTAHLYLFHQLTHLLQKYEYVHLIALDFSKAFDSVKHSTLAENIAELPIKDNVYNWIVNFLTDRHHQNKAKGSISEFLPITASIIQGSGIGPVAYILNASDLHPVHQHNIIFKYADDTYLIVPDIFSRTIPQKLLHISDWAKHHNLKLNQSKSLDIIISLRTPLTSAATFLTRVDSLNSSWCHIQLKTSF